MYSRILMYDSAALVEQFTMTRIWDKHWKGKKRAVRDHSSPYIYTM